MNNNEVFILKGRIDLALSEALKTILSKLNLSQQEFVEQSVNEFVLKNLSLILEKK